MDKEEVLKEKFKIALTSTIKVISEKSKIEINFGNKMINARIETITEKPAYKKAIEKKRCMVIADGYYEWMNTPHGKQPYHITMKNNQLFAFAGIWAVWKNNHENKLETFSIITQPANDKITYIHQRMPVQLKPEQKSKWLNAETAEEALDFVKKQDMYELNVSPVSMEVNSTAPVLG